MPFRPARAPRSRAHYASGVYRFRVARILARRAPGIAVRLPRVRPVRSVQRAPLQSPQAVARPVCRDAQREHRVERRALRVSRRLGARGSFVRPARQCGRHAEVRRRRYRLYMGQRSATAHALARPHRVRAARARLHDEAPRRRARAARNRCGPGLAGGYRVPRAARRDRHRAVAGTELRRRPPFDSERPAQLLGLQPDFVFCAGAAISLALGLGRVQDDGLAHARGRHRSHPRRRLQPYRRGQRTRADAQLQRHRQQVVLPARERPTLLRRQHRLRQRSRSRASERPQDGGRLVALLGERDARRRIPLRPRNDARARPTTTTSVRTATFSRHSSKIQSCHASK